MNSTPRTLEWDWYSGTIPTNVCLEEDSYIETTYSFSRCRSRVPIGISLGHGTSAYLGTMFDVSETGKVTVGAYSLLNGVWMICDNEITIGDYTLFSWNVVIMDSYRAPFSPDARREMLRHLPHMPQPIPYADRPGQPVHIESNVWIGFDVCILPGVRIGEGSIVGARSVVAQNVEPFTIVGGNPAKLIRKLNVPYPSA